MSWNYRVIKFTDQEGKETHRAIHEVYYNDKMEPTAYANNPATVVSVDGDKDPDEFIWILNRMKEALDKECLLEADFKN